MLNMFNCFGVQLCAERPVINEILWTLTMVAPLLLLFAFYLLSKGPGKNISRIIFIVYLLLLFSFEVTSGMVQAKYGDFRNVFIPWDVCIRKTSRLDSNHTITTYWTLIAPNWHSRLEIKLMPGIWLRRSLPDIGEPEPKIQQ